MSRESGEILAAKPEARLDSVVQTEIERWREIQKGVGCSGQKK